MARRSEFVPRYAAVLKHWIRITGGLPGSRPDVEAVLMKRKIKLCGTTVHNILTRGRPGKTLYSIETFAELAQLFTDAPKQIFVTAENLYVGNHLEAVMAAVREFIRAFPQNFYHGPSAVVRDGIWLTAATLPVLRQAKDLLLTMDQTEVFDFGAALRLAMMTVSTTRAFDRSFLMVELSDIAKCVRGQIDSTNPEGAYLRAYLIHCSEWPGSWKYADLTEPLTQDEYRASVTATEEAIGLWKANSRFDRSDETYFRLTNEQLQLFRIEFQHTDGTPDPRGMLDVVSHVKAGKEFTEAWAWLYLAGYYFHPAAKEEAGRFSRTLAWASAEEAYLTMRRYRPEWDTTCRSALCILFQIDPETFFARNYHEVLLDESMGSAVVLGELTEIDVVQAAARKCFDARRPTRSGRNGRLGRGRR